MTRKVILSIALVIIATVLMQFATKSLKANGAVVIQNDGCILFDGNGITYTFTNVRVQTSSQNGNTLTNCRTSDVDPSTQGALIYNYENTGFPCYTSAGFTNDWINVVTPSGHSSLTCHYSSN